MITDEFAYNVPCDIDSLSLCEIQGTEADSDLKKAGP